MGLRGERDVLMGGKNGVAKTGFKNGVRFTCNRLNCVAAVDVQV